MKKKLVCVIISLCLLITIVAPVLSVVGAGSVWNGGVSVPTLSGGYYQIASAENLAWFASRVNSGSSTIKARLTADILLNSADSTANEWVPIGTESNPFKGEFDGAGYTISGLYISGSRDYAGLFGYVAATKPIVDDNTGDDIFVADPVKIIYDLNLTNASVSGGQNVGGIAGYIFYSIISGCSFSGNVTGQNNNVGGICGYAFDYSIIEKCYTQGNITGVIRTGGILGYANINSKVSKSYSEAVVVSTASVAGNSGGICGTVSAGAIENCFFLGSVIGPKRIGGIVGNNTYSTIQGCYVIASVGTTLAVQEYIAAVAGYSLGGVYYNCYYNQPATLVDDANAVARTLDDMTKFSFVRELNENGNAYTFDYMLLNNGYPVFAWSLETAVWAGGVERPSTDSAGYYLISTADELAWFSGLVNGTLANVDQNTAAKARVTENILLNIFIEEGSDNTNTWRPIGSASSPFTGIFIGNGYSIVGVYTNGATNQGLFGYIGTGGNVTEVIVADGLITGTENVGAVAGYNKGIISSSSNASTVKGSKALGGICGYNTGTIKTSFSIGTVECTSDTGSQVGGIVGYNTRATVQQCFNNGLVTGTAGSNYYGGICGFNSGDGIYNCYNAGEVLGGFYIGGLVGYNSSGTVKYCYNRGVVNTQNAINGNVNNFIGYNNGTCSISYSYYDSTIEGSVMNNANGATAKTTAQMTGSGISSELGLQSGMWSNRGDDTYFRYYPQITDIYGANFEKFRSDSLDSVRIVKEAFKLKVKIDGQSDSYHADFTSALNAIGTKKGTIIPVRNITISSTVNITSNVTIRGEDLARTITRGSSFTAAMFNVTGTLSLGDIKDGDDNNTLLIIDGNGSSVASTTAAITLAELGTLNFYQGSSLVNNSSSSQGAGIYMNSDSVLNINGGKIMSHTSTSDGGGIYNDMGTINMSAGFVSSNTSNLKGGGVYNNSGIINISGGELSSNYGKTLGGGIYNIGSGSEVNISQDAQIKLNSSNAGGALYVNSGTVNISGGLISQNFSYNKRGASATTGGGGGAVAAASATINMTGGVIDSNYVYNNLGDGFGLVIYGTLTMSGAAAITNNDVYLARNRTIVVTGELSSSGTVATITPYTYTTSTIVLSGSAMGIGYTKFEVTPNGSTAWNVNSSGYLMDSEIVNVASLSKFGAYSVEYVSVAQAVAAVGADEEGIITIIADNYINETITVKGNVTILSETDFSFTSRRSGSFTGTLFEVQSGATLSFGYTNMEVLGGDVSADSTGGEYILDGGYTYSGAAGTAMINVKAGGELYTYDDFILENSKSTSSGTIIVAGEMHMYGGTIKNNIAINGGAINVAYSGKVTLYGGAITGNSVVDGGLGKAIYSAGTLIRAANVYEYYQNEEIVAAQNSFVTIASNNDVYLTSGKTLVLSDTTSTILLSDEAAVPEVETVVASTMYLTAPNYYKGMPILSGSSIGHHYNSFDITEVGFYVMPDGTIGLNLLVPTAASNLKIDRSGNNFLTGIDLSSNIADYFQTAFLNSDKIEVRALDGAIAVGSTKVGTGFTVNLYDSSGLVIIDTITVLIYGDIDGDGYIDGMDSMYISCIVENLFANGGLSAAQLEAADIDASSSITEADAQYIQMCGLLSYTLDQTR